MNANPELGECGECGGGMRDSREMTLTEAGGIKGHETQFPFLWNCASAEQLECPQ